MLHRVRWAIKQGSFEKPLEGVIEIDETFVGGKNKNRHANKKVKQCQGRAYKDKTPVLGIKERNGEVRAFVVSDTKAETIQPIVESQVEYGSTVYTDEWWAYKNLHQFYNHSIVNHAAREYINGEVYTNNLEGFWGQFKRSIIGIYHNVSKKHLQRYVDEAVYRHNVKHISDFCRTASVLTTDFVGKEELLKVLAKTESVISDLESIRNTIRFGILLKHGENAVENLVKDLQKKSQQLGYHEE